MPTLSERLAALEAKAGKLEELQVQGGFDDPWESAAASPSTGQEWFAAPDEVDRRGRTTAAFKARVRGEALAAGAKMIVWFSPGADGPIPE